MYKLVIVDDEKILREGLANFFDWEAEGFQVVSTLEDGRDAIEYIKKYDVDVIVTDIRMTYISGIELSKYVYENTLKIKVVILSAYKEFEFAKSAMKYGISHYLVKPFNFEEIKEVFTRIRSELDKQAEGELEQKKQIQRYSEIIEILREQFFTDVSLGALRNPEVVKKRIKTLNLQFDITECRCCIFQISISNFKVCFGDNWEMRRDNFFEMIRKFIQNEYDEIYYNCFNNIENGFKIIAMSPKYNEACQLKEKVEFYLEQVKASIKSSLNLDMEHEFKFNFTNIYEMATFNESILAVPKNEENRNISIDDNSYRRIIEQQKMLNSYIGAGNFAEVESLLESFFEELKYMEISYIQNFIVDIFSIIANKLKEFGADIFTEAKGSFEYKAIFSMNSIEEIHNWCRSNLKNIMNYASENKESTDKKIIRKARKFMMENHNMDISMEQVADHVYLSSVYFSKLFKIETGENFIDYLIKIRINKAIELLDNPKYKIYEISDMIGYKSVNYFTRLFKQITGYTPTEYRSNTIKKL